MSGLDDRLRSHPLTLRALEVTGLSYEALSTSKVEVGDPDYPEAWPVFMPDDADPRHICEIQAYAVLVWFMTELEADWRCRDSASRFLLSEERGLHVSDSVSIKKGRSTAGDVTKIKLQNDKAKRVGDVLAKREKLRAEGKAEHEIAGIIATTFGLNAATIRRYFREEDNKTNTR